MREPLFESRHDWIGFSTMIYHLMLTYNIF